jgi:AcrR family transcriptional regulator
MFVNRKKSRTSQKPEKAADNRGERRVPTQERSRQRVERILEAAAQIFASQGHEAATMEAIAARAETSIGSIYQFFPNKAAVYEAILERYHATVRTLTAALLDGPLMEQSWHEILDAAIDALAAWNETDPSFRAVLAGAHLTESVFIKGEAANRELARRVSAVFEKKLPRLPPARRDFVATIAVELASVMLLLSARRPAESKEIIAETKSVLRLYLAPYSDLPDDDTAMQQKGRAKVRSAR